MYKMQTFSNFDTLLKASFQNQKIGYPTESTGLNPNYTRERIMIQVG